MRDSSTCCTCSKTLGLGYQSIRSDEKLEFVEHVLGVLIESRFGDGNPYMRLSDQPVTTCRSQLFANVRLLTDAEIETHLTMSAPKPFYRAFLRENHLRKRVVMRDGEITHITESDAASDTSAHMHPDLKPPAHAGGSPSRGSPTFSGTCDRHTTKTEIDL